MDSKTFSSRLRELVKVRTSRILLTPPPNITP